MSIRWSDLKFGAESASISEPMAIPGQGGHVLQRIRQKLNALRSNFKPSKEKKKVDFLRQMFYLALSDDELSGPERNYILDVGKKINIKEYKIIELSYQAKKHLPLFLNLPSKDRFFYVFHLINLIRVEGEVQTDSVARAQSLLMKQGYAPDTVDIILAILERNEKAGATYEQTYEQLKATLG